MDATKYQTFSTIPIFSEQETSSIKTIKNSYKLLSSKLQIIKDLKIRNMILVSRSKKRIIALDGYGIKITKQEIIK